MFTCCRPSKTQDRAPPDVAKDGSFSTIVSDNVQSITAIFSDPTLKKSLFSLTKSCGEFLSKSEVNKVVNDIGRVTLGVPFVGIGVQALVIIFNNVEKIQENKQLCSKICSHVEFIKKNISEIDNEENEQLLNDSILSLVQSAWMLQEHSEEREGCAKGLWACARSFMCAQSIASTLEHVRLELQQIQSNLNTILLQQTSQRQPHYSKRMYLEYDPNLQKVGLETRIHHVMKLLEQQQSVNECQALGVHGIGGIGKSTLLSALRSYISNKDQYVVALEMLNEFSNDKIKEIQQNLYMQLTNQALEFRDLAEGQMHLASKLKDLKEKQKKKVCLIFDNLQIQNSNIITKILPEPAQLVTECVNYLIVSARERQVVENACKPFAQNNTTKFYESLLLNELDATKLFCRKAKIMFENEEQKELVGKVVPLLGGLPLAVEVYGSFLADVKTREEWNQVVDKLNKAEDTTYDEQDKVFKKIDMSLSLYENSNQIHLIDFMDVANFWKDKPWEDAQLALLWDNGEDGLHKLEEKSLVSNPIDFGDKLHMHDILVNVAKSKAEASHHAYYHMTLNTPISTMQKQEDQVRGLSSDGVDVSTSLLQKMESLRFLTIEGGSIVKSTNMIPQRIKESPKWLICMFLFYFSLVLALVSFSIFESKIIPHIFIPLVLALLVLPMFSFSSQFLPMTMIDTIGSGQLLPKSLTYLTIHDCYNTKILFNSIGKLTQLRSLNLSKNHNFPKHMPSSIFSNLANLYLLNLSKCSEITNLPNSLSKLLALRTLNLSFCNMLQELPNCLGELKNLEFIDLSDCHNLDRLPESIGKLKRLQTLNICNCDELGSLPSSFGQLSSLQTLYFANSDEIVRLPNSFTMLSALKHLDMSGCTRLKDLPVDFGNLLALNYLNLSKCSSLLGLPTSMKKLKSLNFLDVSHCEALHAVDCNLFDGLKPTLKHLNFTACPKLLGRTGLIEATSS